MPLLVQAHRTSTDREEYLHTCFEHLEVEVQVSRSEITRLAKELLEAKLALELAKVARQGIEQSVITDKIHLFEALKHALDDLSVFKTILLLIKKGKEIGGLV